MGTGDGGKYLPSILQLQAMLEKFEIPVPLVALKDTKNVAIVMIEATIPENGVREGDRIDVRVNSVGAAKTLAGGHLVMTPLQSIGLDRVLAFASGPIRLQDVKVGTSGIVKDGATMEADIIHNYISEEWEITLVLEDVHASHALASVIARWSTRTRRKSARFDRSPTRSVPRTSSFGFPPRSDNTRPSSSHASSVRSC